jgi:hypothetical protein
VVRSPMAKNHPSVKSRMAAAASKRNTDRISKGRARLRPSRFFSA